MAHGTREASVETCGACGRQIDPTATANVLGDRVLCTRCYLECRQANERAATEAKEREEAAARRKQREAARQAAATQPATAGKRLQSVILVAGLLLVGLVCLFPPVVSLDEPSIGQSAGRRFLFAKEFSRGQIRDAASQSWERTTEAISLDAQISQAEKKSEDASKDFEKSMKALEARAAAMIAVSAAEEKALQQANASHWPFSGIIRARDYGRAFLECIGIVVLTTIAFLFVRFRNADGNALAHNA